MLARLVSLQSCVARLVKRDWRVGWVRTCWGESSRPLFEVGLKTPFPHLVSALLGCPKSLLVTVFGLIFWKYIRKVHKGFEQLPHEYDSVTPCPWISIYGYSSPAWAGGAWRLFHFNFRLFYVPLLKESRKLWMSMNEYGDWGNSCGQMLSLVFFTLGRCHHATLSHFQWLQVYTCANFGVLSQAIVWSFPPKVAGRFFSCRMLWCVLHTFVDSLFKWSLESHDHGKFAHSQEYSTLQHSMFAMRGPRKVCPLPSNLPLLCRWISPSEQGRKSVPHTASRSQHLVGHRWGGPDAWWHHYGGKSYSGNVVLTSISNSTEIHRHSTVARCGSTHSTAATHSWRHYIRRSHFAGGSCMRECQQSLAVCWSWLGANRFF